MKKTIVALVLKFLFWLVRKRTVIVVLVATQWDAGDGIPEQRQ